MTGTDAFAQAFIFTGGNRKTLNLDGDYLSTKECHTLTMSSEPKLS